MSSVASRRAYSGPALLSFGFRPFFLGAGLWSVAGMLLWLGVHAGDVTLPTAFIPRDWHVHEMLYGYVPAVVAGFLLTAIPNWTGRLPVSGLPLAALAGLWLAGRIAIAVSAAIGPILAAVIDVAFLASFAAVALREIVAGRNWRNLRVLGVLAVLIGGNVLFHLEAIRDGAADYGIRVGLAGAVGLIMLIGGRIVPSFTRNWLARENPGRLPAPFSRFDGIALVAGAIGLVAWIAAPDGMPAGGALLLAGVLHAVRLARWAGDRTGREPLVLVLHVGYGFVPLGFLLLGAAALWPMIVPGTAGVHAWTAGAIGLMTLAVMTRATRGHSGAELAATPATQAIYLAATVAAAARIAAAFLGETVLLQIAGLAWALAFAGFVAAYGPLLIRSRS